MARRSSESVRLCDVRGGVALEAVRAGLGERLRARRSEIEEAALARFREIGFDPATGEDAEYVAGARAAVAESVEYGLSAIERGEQWFGSIPSAAVAQAHRAARSGVSLDKVLLRANAGHTVLEDFVVQEVDLANDSTVLRGVFATLGALLDHFTALMAHEYQREVEHIARSPELRRVGRVKRMLGGDAGPDAAQLGYTLDAWHLGAIATGANAAETVRSLAAGLGCELLSVSPTDGTVWAWFGGQRALDIGDLQRRLSASKRADVSLAVGVSGRGSDGWRRTHRQAQAAMLVALRRPRTLTLYSDVALLAAVLTDVDMANSLVEIHLEPLDSERDSPVSRQTLRAYFAAECNAATAAAALGVDRHTVERRLRTIEATLGRSLHMCRAELEVALELVDLSDPIRPSSRAKSPPR